MGAKDTTSATHRATLVLRAPAVRVLGPLLLLVVLLAFSTPIAGQDVGSSPIELSARAGYDGYYKSDDWLPVRVSAANNGPDIQGHLQIAIGSGGGNDQVVYRSPISLPTLSNKGQTLYVHIPSFVTALEVELVDESGRVVASTQTNTLSGVANDALLYGVVTKEPGRLEYLENVTGGRSDAAVAYLALAELPEVAAALNALDVVIFHAEDSGQLTGDQRQAIESWLDTGGQLVITGGPAWQETSAGLTELLPVEITGTELVDDIPSLRELSGLAFRDPGPYLITNSRLQNGESLIHQAGRPILARKEHGRGSVFFLALDPSLAPLLDWQGGQAVWSEIARFAQPQPNWARGAQNSYAATSAVASLPVANLPAAWALFIFLMIYVIVVGPLNYFILRRSGRRELAWLTIPGLVILFSVTAYLVGFQLKGNETIINQMSIIYGQVDAGQVKVQTLIGLYSPRRATYDLILPPEAIPRPFEQSFGALGGQGNIEAIERADDVTVTGIRVDVGGVETLVADSYQPSPNVAGQARLRTEASNVILDIDVQNNGHVTLENVTVLVGATAIPLGDLAPGGSIDHSERISTLPESPAGTGLAGVYMPPPPANSPLMANMGTILGSTDYYNDREIYPRWQLLQAMAPEYGVDSGIYSPDVLTIIAWSAHPQLELGLTDIEYGSSATSLYFLELPITPEFATGQEMVLPRPLLNWQVLAENGIYDARVSDLFLPTGMVEFEFTPWSNFKSMAVQDVTIVLQAPDGSPVQRLPGVRLWDWAEESWRTAGDPSWGRITIEDPLQYVGPNNAVRIQLNNPGPEGINIQQIYPEMTGTIE